MIDFSKAEQDKIASDEDIMSLSRRILEQNIEAYEVLMMQKNQLKISVTLFEQTFVNGYLQFP